jgi:hypothetical protein
MRALLGKSKSMIYTLNNARLNTAAVGMGSFTPETKVFVCFGLACRLKFL